MPLSPERIGQVLRERRAAAGLSQIDLDRRVRSRRGRMANVPLLERGERWPAFVELEALGAALGVSAFDLLIAADELPGSSP